jgi:hypothetical protein
MTACMSSPTSWYSMSCAISLNLLILGASIIAEKKKLPVEAGLCYDQSREAKG